jgi:hypothetical protein
MRTGHAGHLLFEEDPTRLPIPFCVEERTEGHPPAITQHEVALAVLDRERLTDVGGGEFPDVAREVARGDLPEQRVAAQNHKRPCLRVGQHVPVPVVVVPKERLTAGAFDFSHHEVAAVGVLDPRTLPSDAIARRAE